MTFKQAKAELRKVGISICKIERVEFRVVPFGIPNSEQLAYYTTDLDDAVATGKLMSQEPHVID